MSSIRIFPGAIFNVKRFQTNTRGQGRTHPTRPRARRAGPATGSRLGRAASTPRPRRAPATAPITLSIEYFGSEQSIRDSSIHAVLTDLLSSRLSFKFLVHRTFSSAISQSKSLNAHFLNALSCPHFNGNHFPDRSQSYSQSATQTRAAKL